MRTAGEEFAMALHLLGARPVWDDGSDRVLGRRDPADRPARPAPDRRDPACVGAVPRRVPALSALFGQAVRALAARDEARDWNPYAGREAGPRVYGPAPGNYGLGMGDAAEDYTEAGRRRAGEAWLQASAWALDGAEPVMDRAGLAARVAGAEAFVHPQDLPETDLLLAADYAAHEAGLCGGAGRGRRARRRCTIWTRPTPTRPGRARCVKRSPASCGAAPPIPTGSRG